MHCNVQLLKYVFFNNLLPVECLKCHLVSGESACLSSVFFVVFKGCSV